MDSPEYQLMDAAEGSMWWYRALHARLLEALVPVSGCILDAGCGTGGFLARVAKDRPDLRRVGLESFPAAANRAARKSDSSIVIGSVNSLPFHSSSFDAVVAADVFCHVGVDPPMALDEINRVLRPGGRLVVNMPAFEWLRSVHDRRVHNARRESVDTVKAVLLQAGFEQVRANYWNGLLLPLMILQRKIFARHEYSPSTVKLLPRWLDTVFFFIASVERTMKIPLIAGGSVLAIAHRSSS